MTNVTVDTSFGPSNQAGKLLVIPLWAKNNVTLNPVCKISPQQQIEATFQISAPFCAWFTSLPVLRTLSSSGDLFWQRCKAKHKKWSNQHTESWQYKLFLAIETSGQCHHTVHSGKQIVFKLKAPEFQYFERSLTVLEWEINSVVRYAISSLVSTAER